MNLQNKIDVAIEQIIQIYYPYNNDLDWNNVLDINLCLESQLLFAEISSSGTLKHFASCNNMCTPTILSSISNL